MKIPDPKHPQGKPFKLEAFQAFTTAVIFGWQKRHLDTGRWVRKYNTIYKGVPRKNGKTAWVTGYAPYCMLVEAPDSAQIYSAATKLAQARIAFEMGSSILKKYKRDHVRLRSRKVLDILKNNVTYFPNEVTFEPLPADSDSLDGLGPYLGIIDEFHAHPDDRLIKVIETGMGKWEEPLLLIITTAGFNIYWPCYRYRKRNIDILKGLVEDESSFSMIYTPDVDDSWEDEKVWEKVNPNIGVTVFRDYLQTQYKKAKSEGSTAEVQFKTKNCNMWIPAGSIWLSDEKWMASGSVWDEDMLLGRDCWIGMDLSDYIDLTALAYVFPPTESDPKYRVRWRIFCPEDGIEKRSRSDKVPYQEWVDGGYLVATPGKKIDYGYIVKDIRESKAKYNIRHLEYDVSLSFDIMKQIEPLLGSRRCSTIPQTAKYMNMPIRWIEAMIVDEKLDHGRHPVARWCCSNVVTAMHDDKVKFDKKKTVERIDAMDALAMAVAGYVTDDGANLSKYETQPPVSYTHLRAHEIMVI